MYCTSTVCLFIAVMDCYWKVCVPMNDTICSLLLDL